VIAALVVSDYLCSVRRTHPSTLREGPAWSPIYLAIAIAFGAGVWAFGGISMRVEYFACYVSNEALSIDNLFVFLFTGSPFRGSPSRSAVTRHRLGAGGAHRIYRRPSGNDTDAAGDDRIGGSSYSDKRTGAPRSRPG
jgi:hypothetical protein